MQGAEHQHWMGLRTVDWLTFFMQVLEVKRGNESRENGTKYSEDSGGR